MRTNPFNPILGFRSDAWRRLELAVFKRWSRRGEGGGGSVNRASRPPPG
jgi:hypothetical protein